MMAAPPADSKRLTCPACQRYLGTVDGCYNEFPPCVCGAETIVRFRNRRGRQTVETPSGSFEVKAAGR